MAQMTCMTRMRLGPSTCRPVPGILVQAKIFYWTSYLKGSFKDLLLGFCEDVGYQNLPQYLH